jgi:hypothetical protein
MLVPQLSEQMDLDPPSLGAMRFFASASLLPLAPGLAG